MNTYPDFDHKVSFFPQSDSIDTKQSEKHSSHENYLSSKEWLMVWAKNKIWSIGQKTQPSISRVFLAVVGLFCFISHYYLFFNIKTNEEKKILNWKIINSYFVSFDLPKNFFAIGWKIIKLMVFVFLMHLFLVNHLLKDPEPYFYYQYNLHCAIYFSVQYFICLKLLSFHLNLNLYSQLHTQLLYFALKRIFSSMIKLSQLLKFSLILQCNSIYYTYTIGTKKAHITKEGKKNLDVILFLEIILLKVFFWPAQIEV